MTQITPVYSAIFQPEIQSTDIFLISNLLTSVFRNADEKVGDESSFFKTVFFVSSYFTVYYICCYMLSVACNTKFMVILSHGIVIILIWSVCFIYVIANPPAF